MPSKKADPKKIQNARPHQVTVLDARHPSPVHLDGYPRYEAGNRGQTNPAFEPNEPDIPSTESFSQDPDDVRVTAEESKRTSDQSSRKSKDVTQVSSDTKDSKAKEALDKGEKRQIEKKRNEELQNKKEKKNKRTEHGKTKEKEEKSEKGIKEDQGKTIHTENEHEESQYPQKRKEGDKSSKEARLIKYCILVSRHPRRAFCIALLVHLLLALLMLILLIAGFDILPTEFSDLPLNLIHDEQFLRAEAWRNRNSDLYIHPYLLTGDVIDRQSVIQSNIQVAYDFKSGKGNVFTAERLKEIQDAENQIMNIEGMKNYCLMRWNECANPLSILRFFDGSYASFDSRLYDPNFDDVPGTLKAASENSQTRSILNFHLAKESVVSTDGLLDVLSPITRSLFYLAAPLEGFRNLDANTSIQIERIKAFEMGPLRDKLYDLAKSGVGDLRFTFISHTLYLEDVIDQVVLDLCLAIGSFLFIFLFMWFQTRSLFVTTFALLSIITSFCGANLLYCLIFQFRYFGIFHVLSIFIILGIGADNIFVFFDTWKYSALEGFSSLEMRFSAVYRRAALAMMVTSLTTMIAFFISAFCDLLAVASFGLFSGLLVFVNFISAITYFPTVVMYYHVKFEGKPLCCCHGSDNSKIKDSEDQFTEEKKSPNALVRFFAGPYFHFITHKVARWVIIALYAIFLIIFIYFATTLVPDEQGPKIWKGSTNYGRAKAQQTNEFKPSMEDDVIQVYMIWGLKEQDRSMCSKYEMDSKCIGRTVWDNSFDMNPSHAQYALELFCDKLRNLDDEKVDKLKVRRDAVTGKLQIKCFIENMEAYLERELQQAKYDLGERFRLPTNRERITALMKGNPAFYDMTMITDRFYRYFEVGLSYWLSNGYSGHLTYDYKAFGSMVGEASDLLDTRPLGEDENSGYYYGNRLRYMAIAVNTTLPYGNVGYKQGLPIMENWEEYFNQEVSEMPPSLSGGFQCTPEDPSDSAISNSWHYLKVQKVLANNALIGIVTGICLACPILILATMNVIVGILATLIICAITVTVVGIIPMGGWKLGVLESLNLSLVVGLAVDYVVHLAEAYSRSTALNRKGRVKEMLERMGVSVVSGAVTTLGSALFMLFAKIVFFMQFGIFLFCTIGFSIFYALGLFATLLAIIGPEGETGSIRPLFQSAKRCVTGRKKSDVDCSSCEGKGFYTPD